MTIKTLKVLNLIPFIAIIACLVITTIDNVDTIITSLGFIYTGIFYGNFLARKKRDPYMGFDSTDKIPAIIIVSIMIGLILIIRYFQYRNGTALHYTEYIIFISIIICFSLGAFISHKILKTYKESEKDS